MLAFLSSPATPSPAVDRALRTPLLACLAVVAATSFGSGVSLAAHLGGFIGGAAAMLAISAITGA